MHISIHRSHGRAQYLLEYNVSSNGDSLRDRIDSPETRLNGDRFSGLRNAVESVMVHGGDILHNDLVHLKRNCRQHFKAKTKAVFNPTRPSVHPSIHPSICAAIHPFVVHSSIHRPFVVVASTHASTHLCMHPPTHASTIQRPVVQVYAHSRQEANTIDVHLTEISNSSTMEEYYVNLRCLRRVNKDIAEWVENADPKFWVAAFFMHTQDAGMTTSNGISTPCSSPSIHPSIRPSVHPSVYPSVRPCVFRPSVHPSVSPSVRPCVRPSPFVCLCCARGRARECTAEAAGHSRHGATRYAQSRL